MLGLETLLDRKPGALSGGQRQRVAMGRAMVREPKAFLMDEPLSNLDAKLRVSMRAELSRLHERLGVTTVYVTHDQVEAMTLGQRVAVMRDGLLQQVDTPQNLFHHPANLFVAAFIGSPSMNLVDADVGRRGGPVRVAHARAAGRLADGQRVAPGDPRHAADRLRACLRRRPGAAAHARQGRRCRGARRRDAHHLRRRRAAGVGRGRPRGDRGRGRRAVRRRPARAVHGAGRWAHADHAGRRGRPRGRYGAASTSSSRRPARPSPAAPSPLTAGSRRPSAAPAASGA